MQYSQTYMYPFCVVCTRFYESITKCKEHFCFWRKPLQWRFPSRHLHQSLICSAHCSRCLCFSIFDLYFPSMSVFVPLVHIIREIFNDKLICHREVYSKCYLHGEQPNNRLGCFVSKKWTCKIMTEFHKAIPVKLSKCKLSTIFPYISKKYHVSDDSSILNIKGWPFMYHCPFLYLILYCTVVKILKLSLLRNMKFNSFVR